MFYPLVQSINYPIQYVNVLLSSTINYLISGCFCFQLEFFSGHKARLPSWGIFPDSSFTLYHHYQNGKYIIYFIFKNSILLQLYIKGKNIKYSKCINFLTFWTNQMFSFAFMKSAGSPQDSNRQESGLSCIHWLDGGQYTFPKKDSFLSSYSMESHLSIQINQNEWKKGKD